MVHYHNNIKNFGSPNGLCSSITESKHIAAVKRPWRRSSRYKALSQILKVNERIDKLTTARADFTARGMLADSSIVAAILDAFSNSDHGDCGDGGHEHNEDGDDCDSNNNNCDGDSIDNDNDTDHGPVESEPLMNEVRLARDKGKYCSSCASSTSHKPSNQPTNTHQLSQPSA